MQILRERKLFWKQLRQKNAMFGPLNTPDHRLSERPGVDPGDPRFCDWLPFFCCGVHLKTTTSKMRKEIQKLLKIFRENMIFSRILFNLFLFLFGPRSVLDFWLSNCCNSWSMEKQFSRLCSSLLALTFLEVKEIYTVVNCNFFV